MKYRSVLLDRSFLQALRSEHDPDHEAAKALYWGLVDAYIKGTDQLFALSTVLSDMPRDFRKAALAPLLTYHVARQHLNAAATITGYSPDDALTLVMMERHKVCAVATTRDVWDEYDIEVLKPGATSVGGHPNADGAGEMAGGDSNDLGVDSDAGATGTDLSSRTAPTPVRRSTAE